MAPVLSKKFRIHIHTTAWLTVTGYPTGLNLLVHMQMGEQEQDKHGLSVEYARTDPRKYSFAVRTAEKWNNYDVKYAANREVFRISMGQL
jgi:hypothetical protein